MALTETRPETEAPPAAEPAPAPSTATLDGLVGSGDHKTIGRMWISAGLFFALGALVLQALSAVEGVDLASFSLVEDAGEQTQIWSLGRDLLLFGAVVPMLVGLATFLVPLQIGAPAIAFARGASGAFWTWLFATGLLVVAYALNGGPAGGRADFVVLWVVALGAMVAALTWAMVILTTTVLGARTVGMSLDRVPQTTWSFLVFSLIGVVSLPVLLAELALVYVRVRNGLVPLDDRGSLVGVMDSPHLAPAIYWVAIPVLGMAADIVGVHTSRPVRAHKPVMVALGVLGVLAFGADYFGFASVRTLDFTNGLLVITIAAAILPMLAVMGLVGDSLRRGTPALRVALAGSLVAGLLLLAGAAASLLGLAEPLAYWLDRQTSINVDLDNLMILNGTIFHEGIRAVILGAALVAVIAAVHHWAAKIWGRHPNSFLGLLSVLATAGGALVWGLGAVLAGIDDQPAYPDAALGDGANTEVFTVVILVGAVVMAGGVLLAILGTAGAALGSGDSDDDEAWAGLTLEWATSSPPSVGNFAAPPVVRSATPLADGIDEAGGEAQGDGDETAGEEA